MTNNLIQNKYVIKKLNDVIGTRKNIDYIEDWLKTYEEVRDCLKKNGLLKKYSKGRKKKLVNLSDKEIIHSAKNLKNFKVISDKTPFFRNFSDSKELNENVMPELLASEILMRSFQPNGLGVDLTLKIINEIKALSVSATPYNSDGIRPPLLVPPSSLAPTPLVRGEEPSSNPTGCFGWASVVAARIFGSSR